MLLSHYYMSLRHHYIIITLIIHIITNPLLRHYCVIIMSLYVIIMSLLCRHYILLHPFLPVTNIIIMSLLRYHYVITTFTEFRLLRIITYLRQGNLQMNSNQIIYH